MDSMVETFCPVCSSHDIVFIQKYRYHSELFSGCAIVGCGNCEMIFVDPMPDEDALIKYNTHYFENAHGGISENKLTIAFHSAINLTRVLHVENFKQKKQGVVRSVLEIGPGPGHFARHWLHRNKETTHYKAVDSDQSCYHILTDFGVKVYDDIAKLPQEQFFDLVVISHVLEHTSHPKEFIDNCTRLLLPGGILFIEVPCKDFAHKDFIEPHLLFFDKNSMKYLLENTGFDNTHLSYHGNTIRDLQNPASLYRKMINKIKNAILSRGVYFPFSIKEAGLEAMVDPLERAVVKSHKAHIEQGEPSWWLRVLAVKK